MNARVCMPLSVAAVGRTLLLACLVLLVPVLAMAQDTAPTERDLQARVDDASRRQDYSAAVTLLEMMIERFPESNNEQMFWDLAKFCDTYGLDYGKAVRGYRLYAVRFPQGRFSKRFQDRLAYLESHRTEWEALKQFSEIRNPRDKRPVDEGILLAEKLLTDHPDTTLKFEIHFWLAGQLFKSEKLNRARRHIDQCMASLPTDGRERAIRPQALDLYAKIAAAQHDYRTALQKVDELRSIDAARYSGLQSTIDDLRFQQKAWWVFLASLITIATALLGALAARPWRHAQFASKPARMLVLLGIMAALCAGPVALLRLLGERIPSTFWALAAFGCSSLVFLWLTSALQHRIGRRMYVTLSLLFVLSAVYAAFYVTDMAQVFIWPLEELHRHG